MPTDYVLQSEPLHCTNVQGAELASHKYTYKTGSELAMSSQLGIYVYTACIDVTSAAIVVALLLSAYPLLHISHQVASESLDTPHNIDVHA